MTQLEARRSPLTRSLDSVRSYFAFAHHKTNFYTEIVAGVATYLSLSYIFVLNPTILGQTGLNPSAVLFATVVASAGATLVMGLWAKLPFAVAPGLEMNGYFSLVICKAMGFTWEQALAIVFFSGVTNLLFTRFQFRKSLVETIPSGLRRAMATSVGVFVASIGLQLAHIISYRGFFIDWHSISASSLASHEAMILYLGLVIAAGFYGRVVTFPMGMLVSIIAGVVLCALWGVGGGALHAASNSYLGATLKLDPSFVTRLTSISYIAPVIVLFLIDFIGGAGKFVGLSAATNIQDDEGNVPRLKRGLYVDGGGTVAGSLLGTSSLVVFVESAIGIGVGGRTGLTAVVCAVLIGLSLFFAPLLAWVPPQAVTGVLVFVAYLLSPWKIDPKGAIAHTTFDLWVGIAMALVAFLTFGIDKAMAVGFWCYFFHGVWEKRDLRYLWWIGAVAGVLTFTTIGEYSMVLRGGN